MSRLISSAALAALGVVVVSVAAAAEESGSGLEQVVVTATRFGDAVRRDLIGSSVTVLEPVDLERRQVRIVSDVLRDVPGVSVNRSGAVGGVTQVRVRGTEGNHVLVLIDGMEVADPYYSEFDFATLIADEVARVEVLRGQQSALYGSDAIGGVIHYMTATGKELPGFRTRVEGGSFGTWEGAARYAGSWGDFDYALSGGYQTTDGVPTSHIGTREVGAENAVLAGRFEYAPSDNFRVRAVTRYAATDAETNDQDYSVYGVFPYGWVIDSDDHYKNTALYGLVRAELDSFDRSWRNAVTVQGVDAGRDGYSDGALSYADEGSRTKASYESSLRFGSQAFSQTLTGAVDFERERMQNTGPFLSYEQGLQRQIDNTGLVAQYDAIVNERIGFGAALRHDHNDRFKSADTYRLQGSYRFDTGTRLRAAAGSGIKNPGMTEIFGYDPGSYSGNPNLKPERSEGWEAGVEQTFSGVALIGVTYFDNTLHDEIITRYSDDYSTSSPDNATTDSTQKGVEVFARGRVGKSWRIDASYTHLHARQEGLEEIRRPPNIASLSVDWRTPEDRAGVNLTVRYNGETYDSNFTGVGGSRVLLSEFTLVNLGADFSVSDSLGLYARVENLFDEEYEEVYTYRTAGRAAYFGMKSSF